MIAKSIMECRKSVEITRKLLESLSFILSLEKCQLDPQKQCTFLGFVFDSYDYSMYLTSEKRGKIFNLITTFNNKDSCKIRDAAQVIGTLISACPGAKYGWLYTKKLKHDKFIALKNSANNLEKRMIITNEMKEDLKWWIKYVFLIKNLIRERIYVQEIYSDASKQGWGAVC